MISSQSLIGSRAPYFHLVGGSRHLESITLKTDKSYKTKCAECYVRRTIQTNIWSVTYRRWIQWRKSGCSLWFCRSMGRIGSCFSINANVICIEILLWKYVDNWRPTKGVVKVKRLPERVGSIAAKTHAAKEASGKILGRFSALFSIVNDDFWNSGFSLQ